MRYDIPVCKRCCFCIPLRYGLLTWGYIKVLPCFLYIVSSVYECIYIIHSHSFGILEIILTSISFASNVTNLVLTFLLIVAAHKKSPRLLTIYYRCEIGAVAVNVGLLLFEVAECLTGLIQDLNNGEELYFFKYMAFSLLIEIIYICFELYMIAMARSEILKLNSKHEFRFTNHAAEAQCQYYSYDEQQKHHITDHTDHRHDHADHTDQYSVDCLPTAPLASSKEDLIY